LALTGLTALTLTGLLLDLALGLALAVVVAAFLTVRLRHLPILSFHKQSALESHEVLSKDGHLGLDADADAGLGFGGDFAFLEPGFCACPHLDVLASHLHTTHSSFVFKDGHTELSGLPPAWGRR
jgi:hypothetical protein